MNLLIVLFLSLSLLGVPQAFAGEDEMIDFLSERIHARMQFLFPAKLLSPEDLLKLEKENKLTEAHKNLYWQSLVQAASGREPDDSERYVRKTQALVDIFNQDRKLRSIIIDRQEYLFSRLDELKKTLAGAETPFLPAIQKGFAVDKTMFHEFFGSIGLGDEQYFKVIQEDINLLNAALLADAYANNEKTKAPKIPVNLSGLLRDGSVMHPEQLFSDIRDFILSDSTEATWFNFMFKKLRSRSLNMVDIARKRLRELLREEERLLTGKSHQNGNPGCIQSVSDHPEFTARKALLNKILTRIELYDKVTDSIARSISNPKLTQQEKRNLEDQLLSWSAYFTRILGPYLLTVMEDYKVFIDKEYPQPPKLPLETLEKQSAETLKAANSLAELAGNDLKEVQASERSEIKPEIKSEIKLEDAQAKAQVEVSSDAKTAATGVPENLVNNTNVPKVVSTPETITNAPAQPPQTPLESAYVIYIQGKKMTVDEKRAKLIANDITGKGRKYLIRLFSDNPKLRFKNAMTLVEAVGGAPLSNGSSHRTIVLPGAILETRRLKEPKSATPKSASLEGKSAARKKAATKERPSLKSELKKKKQLEKQEKQKPKQADLEPEFPDATDGTFNPHGKSHSGHLPPAAIKQLREVFTKAGITPKTLQLE